MLRFSVFNTARACLNLMVISLFACSQNSTQESHSQSKRAIQKNVLFILVDDLGVKDLTIEGSNFYETPNIDELAKKGVRFTQGYSASQVCSPSRASIITGKYVTNHGVTTWIGDKSGEEWRERGRFDSHDPAPYQDFVSADEVTIAEQFRDRGYDTFFAGKWHLGGGGSSPEDHGFNINIGGWDSGSPRGGYFSPYDNPRLKDGPNGESLTLRLANETAAFLDNQRDKDTPFFAFLSFYAVHAPIQTSKELWKKYRNKALNQNLVQNTPRFKIDRRRPVRQIQDNPIFAGLVESMDTAVGIVLDKLDDAGFSNNTIVVFTSDNGGLSSGDGYGTSSLPYRGGKGRQFEGGIRVPYYIYAPSMAANGTDVAIPVSGVDLYPTLLDLADIPRHSNHNIDGISLTPLLEGETIPSRTLFWHYPHYANHGGEPSSMIRKGDWKLIYYHEDHSLELYNLAKDIGEQNNVAEDQQAITRQLKTELDKWLSDTGAKFPTPNTEYDLLKRNALFENMKNTSLPKLETQHDRYLDSSYSPNKTWWGSEIN